MSPLALAAVPLAALPALLWAAPRRVAIGAALLTLALSPWAAAHESLDALSVPLLPFASLIAAAVFVFLPAKQWTHGAAVARLTSVALLLGAFASRDPRVVSALVVAGMAPGFGVRVGAWYLGAAALAWLVGQWAPWLLAVAVAVRIGLMPVHSWMPEAFERGPFTLILLMTAPQVGTYAAIRLGVPADVLGYAALATAPAAAGLALVQRDARRMFAYLLLSQSALVVAGLEGATESAVAGGLTAWLATGLAMTGFGLTILALEVRRGPARLDRLHGGYDLSPIVAACFLVLGLASVGLPATLGFVGHEMLSAGAAEAHPLLSVVVIAATSLNGITVMRTYFALFCGAKPAGLPPQRIRRRERLAALALVAVLIGGGLYSGPIVRLERRAARAILDGRPTSAPPHTSDSVH